MRETRQIAPRAIQTQHPDQQIVNPPTQLQDKHVISLFPPPPNLGRWNLATLPSTAREASSTCPSRNLMVRQDRDPGLLEIRPSDRGIRPRVRCLCQPARTITGRPRVRDERDPPKVSKAGPPRMTSRQKTMSFQQVCITRLLSASSQLPPKTSIPVVGLATTEPSLSRSASRVGQARMTPLSSMNPDLYLVNAALESVAKTRTRIRGKGAGVELESTRCRWLQLWAISISNIAPTPGLTRPRSLPNAPGYDSL